MVWFKTGNFTKNLSSAWETLFSSFQSNPPVSKAPLKPTERPLVTVSETLAKQIGKTQTPPSCTSFFQREQALIAALFERSVNLDSYQKKVVRYCQMLLQNGQKNPTSLTASNEGLKELIAQIVYLAEKDLSSTCTLLEFNEIEKTTKAIQNAFNKELQKITQQLKDLQIQHEKVPLQKASRAVAVKKTVLLARLLITSSGVLNLGLIDSIIIHFFPTATDRADHEKETVQTLIDIKHSMTLQEQLNGVTKPINPDCIANDIIRITLKLPLNVTPTNQHAQIVALASLLSDIRQEEAGGCFTANHCLLSLFALRNKILNDFKHLLAQGHLTRKKQGENTIFAPILDLNDHALQEHFHITREGQIKTAQGYIWEAPGFLSMGLQIGWDANQLQNNLQNVIKDLFTKEPKSKKILKTSAEEIIIKCLEIKLIESPPAPPFTSKHFDDLKNVACLAFCAETNIPLLSTWESCVSAMTYSKETQNLRHRILRCINLTLHNHWPSNLLSGLTSQAKKVRSVFKKVLNDGIQIRYDEHAPIKTIDKRDGHSKTYGALVLHEVFLGNQLASSRRVETPEDFRGFVLNRLKIAQHTIQNEIPLNDLRPYNQVIEKIRSFIEQRNLDSRDFLYHALREFHSSNRDLEEGMKNWRQLPHLPFRDAINSNNVPVYNKGTGFILELPEFVRPKNAPQLLSAFIIYGKKYHSHMDNDSVSQELTTDLSEHFNLTPQDPSIVKAFTSNLSPPEWIQKNLIFPCQSIANIPLNEEQKKLFINEIHRQMLPEEDAKTFKDAAETACQTYKSVYKVGQQLLRLLTDFHPKCKNSSKSALEASLTNILFNHILPAASVQKLSDHAVSIANSHRLDPKKKQIHFVCFFNPLCQNIQLGTIDSERKNLLALDQNEWVAYIPWERYGIRMTPDLSSHNLEVLSI